MSIHRLLLVAALLTIGACATPGINGACTLDPEDNDLVCPSGNGTTAVIPQ